MTFHRWANPDRRISARICLLCSAVLTAAVTATGALFAPSFPEMAYWGHWTPYHANIEKYRGRILDARVGTVSIPSWNIEESERVREDLLTGTPVLVTVLAGPRTERLSKIFGLGDSENREILLIGPDRSDMVLRYRMRAADFRLDQPDLRMRNGVGVEAGDTVTMSASLGPDGACLQFGQTDECGLGFTAGDGWKFLIYPEHFPRWLMQLVSVWWIAGLFAPIGFWYRHGVLGVTALTLGALGLALVPLATLLLATPVIEWLAAAGGIGVGVGLARVVKRTAPRSRCAIRDP